MGRIRKRIKEVADRLVARAELHGEFEHHMPNIFDGSLDSYISWLKYYNKVAKSRNIQVMVHLDGKFKLKRNQYGRQ